MLSAAPTPVAFSDAWTKLPPHSCHGGGLPEARPATTLRTCEVIRRSLNGGARPESFRRARRRHPVPAAGRQAPGMVAATAPWEAGANASNCSAAWMRPEQDAPSSKGRVHQHITELCPRLSELSRYHPGTRTALHGRIVPGQRHASATTSIAIRVATTITANVAFTIPCANLRSRTSCASK